ncbi:MAG: hypothetical protein AAF604_20190 [Acidobacteriota bacterium]
MIVFSSEFPITTHRRPKEFLQSIQKWILGSPHTSLNKSIFKEINSSKSWSLTENNETIEYIRAESSTRQITSIRYTKISDEVKWTTTASLSIEHDSWIGVRTFCESTNPGRNLPPVKKPIIIKNLLADFGGGKDGILPVQTTPHRLNNVDIDIAILLIAGGSKCYLPIVYLSAPFRSSDEHINPNTLSQDLSGMAHVVVEPNREFSIRLKQDVDSRNVYGGTAGIYWPDGGGKDSFFLGHEFDSVEQISNGIKEALRTSLISRRPLQRCTWGAAKEFSSQIKIQELKDRGSQEIQEYIDSFDQEIESKNQQIDDANKEIDRLRQEVKSQPANFVAGSGLTLHPGNEQELFPGEAKEFLIEALQSHAMNSLQKDSRKRRLLESILESNITATQTANRRKKIKNLFKGFKKITATIRSELRKLGLSINEEGNHLKISIEGDQRFKVTTSKTGSDHRGGHNIGAQINRSFF